MKKHLVLTLFFAFTAAITSPAQSQTFPLTDASSDALLKVRQVVEQYPGIFSDRDYENDRDRCDCDKCQKSKKHNDCKQKGNHYGKHKNRHEQHSCKCAHNDCLHDRDDNDRCGDRNRRDRDDDGRWGDTNRRNQGDEYRQKNRSEQRTAGAKVKPRPTPTAKPTPTTRPVAKKKVNTRPAGTR